MFCTVALVALEFKVLLHVRKYIEELNRKIPFKNSWLYEHAKIHCKWRKTGGCQAWEVIFPVFLD